MGPRPAGIPHVSRQFIEEKNVETAMIALRNQSSKHGKVEQNFDLFILNEKERRVLLEKNVSPADLSGGDETNAGVSPANVYKNEREIKL